MINKTVYSVHPHTLSHSVGALCNFLMIAVIEMLEVLLFINFFFFLVLSLCLE